MDSPLGVPSWGPSKHNEYSERFKNKEHEGRVNLTGFLFFFFFQRCWREFYEKQNRAATVIQTAWRSSLKRPQHEAEDDEKMSNTRPGRVRYTYSTNPPPLLAM